MDQKKLCNVPIIEITDLKKDASQLLVIDFGELFTVHQETITRPHRIFYYELLFIIEGSGNLWVDSNKHSFNDKTMLTVSKGQIQVMEYSKNIKGFALLFSDEYIYKYPQDLGWINNLFLFDPSLVSPVINLPETEYIELLIILSKIRAEINSENAFAKDEILFSLLKTFLLITERIKRINLGYNIRYEGEWSYITKFKERLEQHYFTSRHVQHYANLLSITPKKLNEITNNCYGKPAKRIIEERVLLEIKRLLIYTDQSVKEIGHSLGFSDPTNFIKFFKKYIRVTPAEFRTSNKRA